MLVAWCAGTLAGALGGATLGDPETNGLDAMFPALFLALVCELLRDSPARAAALIGGAIALILLPVTPAGLPVIAAVAAPLIGVRRRR
jgi:predicted branched-subunit amino acid permease